MYDDNTHVGYILQKEDAKELSALIKNKATSNHPESKRTLVGKLAEKIPSTNNKTRITLRDNASSSTLTIDESDVERFDLNIGNSYEIQSQTTEGLTTIVNVKPN